MPTSSASSGSGCNGPKTYAIDVRIFLAAVTTTMAIAFGAGVGFDPTIPIPSSPSSSPTTPPISASDRADILNERHVNLVQPTLEDLGTGAVQYDSKSQQGRMDDKAAQYEPAGQHLLVDIANVEEAFLNSEARLSDAMVRSVEAAGLTMLSYHCHALQPAGVSCVGVLLESHISFHTWPEEGVITLDLFTCGPKPLLPHVPDLERLFGIPRIDPTTGVLGKAKTQWSHELRGFRNKGPNAAEHLDSKSDLAYWIMSALQYAMKEQIVSTQSPHQRIDIWDFLDVEDTPSHEDAIKHNLTAGDPRWLTPEIATPDRYLFLNGVIMHMKDNEREFHESLVHPGMFAHPNPTNVAILGGGHGAALREVLKHNTVKSATVIDIDEQLVEIAREHLSYLTDCTAIVGGSDDCYDDERAKVVYEDARDYFAAYSADKTQDRFDVVVLDMHDLSKKPSPTDYLTNDPNLFDNILASLSDDGVIVMKLGNAPTIHDPRASLGSDAEREAMMVRIEKNPAVNAMLVYEEAHCGFNVPAAFMVVCKDVSCRKRWYASADVTDTEIYARLLEPVDEKSSLIMHYDGSTQENFQYTPIAWETVYCRRDPVPFECAYRGLDVTKDAYEYEIDYEEEDGPKSSFEIKTNKVDGKSMHGIFALDDIPKGSYIMPYDLASSFSTTQDVLDNLQKNTEVSGAGSVTVIEDFLKFVDVNGHTSMSEGREETFVETGATFMMRISDNVERSNVGKWMPTHPSGKIPSYSPVYERHMISFNVFLVASKDIKSGDELVKPASLWNL